MNDIGLQDWFQTPPGRYLLGWERSQFDDAVADVFGYHALQLGLPELDTLQGNRMPHRWLATSRAAPAPKALLTPSPLPLSPPSPLSPPLVSDVAGLPVRPRAALVTDFSALPFPAASLDLVVLPHALELSTDPHTTLREVERVLVPEGRLVISGLNPASLWALRQQRAHVYRRMGLGTQLFLPDAGEFIGYRRLRDWLRLLSFEVETGRFGCYRPAVESEDWLRRFEWLDAVGDRWWPIFGAVYFVVAVKRVRGLRLIGPAWKPVPKRAAAPVSIAGRAHRSPAPEPEYEP